MIEPTSVFTLVYRDTPAQLVGLLWENGDTGKAVIRLKGEGAYLRVVRPSELEKAPNLRLTSPPRSEESR